MGLSLDFGLGSSVVTMGAAKPDLLPDGLYADRKGRAHRLRNGVAYEVGTRLFHFVDKGGRPLHVNPPGDTEWDLVESISIDPAFVDAGSSSVDHAAAASRRSLSPLTGARIIRPLRLCISRTKLSPSAVSLSSGEQEFPTI
jgi:hypothetical protein